ncbi:MULTISPECIES: Na/Pi cotransporter family protein [Rahnella]|uniref:Na/Pi cotransporter family protein n=1 Tax=Rahnella laticis TaxID=2787622 RepID=A0ABS0E1E4_9GAMM|nr:MULTISPECIES: Na/Pi cotransporter family protein [Rahnella]MBF7978917.1 Na/Pi cotransporter family protein [Rahnella laticis]MBF7999007.1 Na/Pi cotransporter family protein [Rahnella sp. LAC-M12]
MFATTQSGTTLLINLAGAIALLLWGSHMISSALQRGFGTPLRHWMGRHLKHRGMALLSGVGITCLLQSSTAVSLMATSFTAAGTLSLAPALAVMLGANVGSTLVVQLMSFNTAIAVPLLMLSGFIVFKMRDHTGFESAGCAMIGLGLMLLALSLLGATLGHIESTPVFRAVMSGLQGDTLIALSVAVILTLVCHSSVAVILLIASLAATGVMTPVTAMVLVLGANIGGALPPVLNAGTAVARRLPVGNLLIRCAGCVVALAFMPLLARLADNFALSTPQLVVWFHTAFSAVLALVFIGLTGPVARLLERLFPEEARAGDPGMPVYLDETGLDIAYIGLSNSVRESLRAADMLNIMLDRLQVLFQNPEKGSRTEIRQLDQSLDMLSAAIRAYLADLAHDGLSDADADRAQEILMFVINVEHAGDILSSSLAELAARRTRRGETFSEFERNNIALLHTEILTSQRLAVTAFLGEDHDAAHQLVARKEVIRQIEATASREHFKKLRDDKNAWAESGDIFQRVLRDYRRVHHHIAAVAYPVIDRRGDELRAIIENNADV